MAYNPTTWKDQIVTDPTKYKITKENGAEEVVNIERVPGEIIQEGTRITADKLNNIEEGIKGAADLVGDLAGEGRTGETVKKNANDIASLSTQMADLERDKLDKSAYTASDVLAKIKTVDGVGSGLNADMLDGKHVSEIFKVVTGDYIGDSNDGRSINIGFRPKMVIINRSTSGIASPLFWIIRDLDDDYASILFNYDSIAPADLRINDNGFYFPNGWYSSKNANGGNIKYNYIAFK